MLTIYKRISPLLSISIAMPMSGVSLKIPLKSFQMKRNILLLAIERFTDWNNIRRIILKGKKSGNGKIYTSV